MLDELGYSQSTTDPMAEYQRMVALMRGYEEPQKKKDNSGMIAALMAGGGQQSGGGITDYQAAGAGSGSSWGGFGFGGF
jgi:hypothetical protein